MTNPIRDEIIQNAASHFYSNRILNNTHRGDVVETIVLEALGEEWNHVGLGWHSWDLQRGSGSNRVRVQVRQSAALQVWGPTKSRSVTFGWKKSAPSYLARDFPDEKIETEGWFCDIFVIGLHQETDPKVADQVDPDQWEFLVIPVCDLNREQKSIGLGGALKKWKTHKWDELPAALDAAIEALGASEPSPPK